MKSLSVEERRALASELDAMRRQVLHELTDARIGGGVADAAAHEVHANADDAELEREDDIRLAEIEVDRQRLFDIEEAQRRMADGRYGICVACGEEIPRSRLLAQPTAIRCAACQAAREARPR